MHQGTFLAFRWYKGNYHRSSLLALDLQESTTLVNSTDFQFIVKILAVALCWISSNFYKTLHLIPIIPNIAKSSFPGLDLKIGGHYWDISDNYSLLRSEIRFRFHPSSNISPAGAIMQIVTLTIRYLLSTFCSTSPLTNQTVFTGDVLHRILS